MCFLSVVQKHLDIFKESQDAIQYTHTYTHTHTHTHIYIYICIYISIILYHGSTQCYSGRPKGAHALQRLFRAVQSCNKASFQGSPGVIYMLLKLLITPGLSMGSNRFDLFARQLVKYPFMLCSVRADNRILCKRSLECLIENWIWIYIICIYLRIFIS